MIVVVITLFVIVIVKNNSFTQLKMDLHGFSLAFISFNHLHLHDMYA
jgi:hypothetical protein